MRWIIHFVPFETYFERMKTKFLYDLPAHGKMWRIKFNDVKVDS
jgi:hypothetical protein